MFYQPKLQETKEKCAAGTGGRGLAVVFALISYFKCLLSVEEKCYLKWAFLCMPKGFLICPDHTQMDIHQ